MGIVSLVPSNREGSHNNPARDARALAHSRISLLLALEVAPTGRVTADRDGAACLDSADEPFGARHASTASCSSWGLRSRRRVSPSTWSSDGGHPARDGEPSCVIMLQTLPPWTYLLSQLSISVSKWDWRSSRNQSVTRNESRCVFGFN